MPHQRFLESEVLEEAKQQELAVTYYGLNTVILLEQVNLKQESLRRRAKSRYKLLAWLG